MSATMQMVKIPSNVNIIGWKDKSTPIVQNKSRRSRFKTPKAVRDKMAQARKKLKLPLMPIAAVGVPVLLAADAAMQHAALRNKLKRFFMEYQSYYTGIVLAPHTGAYARYDWKRQVIGLGSLAGLKLDSAYLGARRYANTLLGNANVPILRT